MTPGRQRTILVGIIAVVGLILLVGLLGKRLGFGAATTTESGAARSTQGRDMATRQDRPGVDPPQLPKRRAAANERELGDDANVASLARTTVDDYRKRARHPRWSQPLTGGEDPILRDREVSPVSAAGPDGADPTLVVFPDQVSFEAPEPILLYAYLSAGGQRIAADQIRGTVMTENLEPLAEVAYRDDGTGGDQLAGDGIYTAVLNLEENQLPTATASYLVKVRAVTGEQQERLAAGGFLYSVPDAHLTGNYRDGLAGGDLVIDAEMDANQTGRFHIEATLYNKDGSQPIAWAQQAAELPSGRHWLSLRFQGLILNERQIDGPYLLRFVALSTATQMPNAKNRLVENAFVTGGYRFNQFSTEPFNDPDLLDAADRLEQTLDGLGPDAQG